MKKIKIFAMLLSLACATGFYSCSDDDDIKPALQSPTVSETAAAYNSLTFEWSEVADATQYGYRLVDSEGTAVNAGVTHDKSVTITGLKPSSTYTLEVWAFASMDGDYSTPPAVTLTATTDSLVKLATPTGLTMTTENGYNYTVTWNPVENAETYTYTVRDTDGALIITDTTESTSVTVKDIENGDYVFYVYAAGYAGYADSDSATADFNVNKPEEVKPIWTVKGTYYSAQMNASWTAVMDAYDDGTYSIRAFYGVEGYDLDFAINTSDEEDMFSILNGEYVYEDGYYSWQVPTGLSNPSTLIAYPWYNYSYMDGDKNQGEVAIGNYYGDGYEGWGYDEFTWPLEDSGMTVDDLVGTYNNHFVGVDYYLTSGNYEVETNWDNTWEDYATVSKVSDTKVSVDGLFYTGFPLTGTVDFSKMSITFEIIDNYYYYYRLCDAYNPDSPAVGYINIDGTITVPDFGMYIDYGSASNPDWVCFMYGTATLTKSSSSGMPHRKGRPTKKR